MSISRREARFKIMTCLYQISLYKKEKLKYKIEDVLNSNEVSEEEFVCSLVNDIINHEDELCDVANKYLKQWTIDRLGYTDQAILKLGIYEIMFTDTDARVVINEALELAKQYSDDAVVKMINGVLDKVFHEVRSDV